MGPGRDLFTDVPVVHTVAQSEHPAAISADPRLVGIRGVFDARRTVEVALGFHPHAREVLIVCATAKRDGFLESELRRQLAGLETKARITYLVDLPLDETLARTTNRGASTLVLFVVFYDPNDKAYTGRYPQDIASEIARTSGAPISGLFSSYLHDGVVGGYVYSLEAAAATAARTALRILAGEQPADIAPLYAPIVPTFDWRQLQRWKIDEARLPPGEPGVVPTGERVGDVSQVLRRRRRVADGRDGAHRAAAAPASRPAAGAARRGTITRGAGAADRGARARRAGAAREQPAAGVRFRTSIGARMNSWRCSRTSCATRWRRSDAVRHLARGPRRGEHGLGARDDRPPGTQLTRLVDDLLDVLRITLGKVELRQERLNEGTSPAAVEACRSSPKGDHANA